MAEMLVAIQRKDLRTALDLKRARKFAAGRKPYILKQLEKAQAEMTFSIAKETPYGFYLKVPDRVTYNNMCKKLPKNWEANVYVEPVKPKVAACGCTCG